MWVEGHAARLEPGAFGDRMEGSEVEVQKDGPRGTRKAARADGMRVLRRCR